MKKACGSHGVPRIYFQLLYLQHKANTMWAASCCGAKHGEKNSSRSAFPNQNECHRLPFNIDIVEPKEWGPGPCQFWRSIALFGFASNVKVINHDKPQFRLQIHLHFSKALSYGFGAVCSLGGWSWLTCIIMSLVSRFLRLGHSIAFLHGHWIMGNTHWFHGKTIWKTFFLASCWDIPNFRTGFLTHGYRMVSFLATFLPLSAIPRCPPKSLLRMY